MTTADRPLAAVMRCKAARRRPDICLPASQAIAASFGDTSPIMLGASVYSEESVATRRIATGARVGAPVGAVSAGPLKRRATYTHTANTDRRTAAAATVAPSMAATAAVVAVSAGGGGGGGGNASGSFMRKQTRHAIISHAKKTQTL